MAEPESIAEMFRLVDQAVMEGKLSAPAAVNLMAWLTEPRYAEYASDVAAHVAGGKWRVLDEAFWTTIPFGTAG